MGLASKLDSVEVKTVMDMSGLAYYLVQDQLLTVTAAALALEQAQQQKISLIRYLVRHAIVSSEAILQCCAKHYELPILHSENEIPIDHDILSADLIRLHRVIPLSKQHNRMTIAMSDPTLHKTIDTIRFQTRCDISLVLMSEEKLNDHLEKYFSPKRFEENLVLLNQSAPDESSYVVQENSVHYDEPLISFVDELIKNAIRQCASDIHIESYQDHCRIRYRQDGILQKVTDIPLHLGIRLIARLKVLAKLDIAERRLPQDGRFQLHHIDLRMNTCPTLFGEKIVLRLLDANHTALDIHTLGLNERQAALLLQKISQPQGLILVAGPTGSGKTVTLYSALHYLNTAEKNISTAEDPIEIQLKGINQVNINPKIGLHFSTILKTFLRQDPDILMIGEIRDTETAEIAIQAAQTGHLVFSTLHANNTLESLARLQAMGIPTYHLTHSISLLISQRLVRKLCDHCKQLEILSADICLQLGFNRQHAQDLSVYHANGCALCTQGYVGRIGIFELLPLTEEIAQLILSQASHTVLIEKMQQENFISLRQAGFEKVKQGLTSVTEINRVISC